MSLWTRHQSRVAHLGSFCALQDAFDAALLLARVVCVHLTFPRNALALVRSPCGSGRAPGPLHSCIRARRAAQSVARVRKGRGRSRMSRVEEDRVLRGAKRAEVQIAAGRERCGRVRPARRRVERLARAACKRRRRGGAEGRATREGGRSGRGRREGRGRRRARLERRVERLHAPGLAHRCVEAGGRRLRPRRASSTESPTRRSLPCTAPLASIRGSHEYDSAVKSTERRPVSAGSPPQRPSTPAAASACDRLPASNRRSGRNALMQPIQ